MKEQKSVNSEAKVLKGSSSSILKSFRVMEGENDSEPGAGSLHVMVGRDAHWSRYYNCNKKR